MPSDVVFGEDFSWAQTSTIGYATDEATAGVSIATGISGMPGRCLQIDSGTTRYVGFPLPGAYSEGLLSVAGFIANGTTTGLNMTTLRYFDAYPTDPATTAAWATAGVNAAELVLERIS